jgi:hypothetical protein
MRTGRRFGVTALGVAALAVLLSGVGQAPVRAQPPNNIHIQAYENGFGVLSGFLGPQRLPFMVGQDPGPGGLPNALLYDLLNPPGLVAGDVLVTEPGGGVGDIIRFNTTSFVPGSAGEMVFYSALGGGMLADTGFPTANYANQATATEVGGIITYTPTAGQPGFVAGASLPVEYVLISDVPEPASLTMLGIGAAALAGYVWRKRRQAA